jgi:uncharacterized protein YggL (DUF469 family)
MTIEQLCLEGGIVHENDGSFSVQWRLSNMTEAQAHAVSRWLHSVIMQNFTEASTPTKLH